MLRRFASKSALPLAVAARFASFQQGGQGRGGQGMMPPPQQGGMMGGRGGMMQGMDPREMEQMQMQMQQRGMRGGAPEEQQQPEEDVPPPPPEKPVDPKFVQAVVRDDGVAVLTLSSKPVNSLSMEVLQEINAWFSWLGFAPEVKAVILTSDIPTVFSAGLDIREMVKPKEERFREFWASLQEMFLLMHTFPRPLIGAINGNAPAGGCIMSLCCDYRIMAKGPAARPDRAYRIGLNETKLGLVAPPWLMANYSYVLGSERKAERLLMLGETPTAEEAKVMGLVDEVVEEGAVMAAAEAEVKRQLAIPSDARWMTKDLMRRSVIELLANPETREYDTDFHAQMIGGPEMQKNIASYLERLKKK